LSANVVPTIEASSHVITTTRELDIIICPINTKHSK